MEFCNKDLKTFLEKDRPQRKLSEKEAQICMRQLGVFNINTFKHKHNNIHNYLTNFIVT